MQKEEEDKSFMISRLLQLHLAISWYDQATAD